MAAPPGMGKGGSVMPQLSPCVGVRRLFHTRAFRHIKINRDFHRCPMAQHEFARKQVRFFAYRSHEK